jgi:hypothetical protein
MTPCDIQRSGALDLYFYGELTPDERRDLERHLAACAECHEALDDLRTIRTALASTPPVAAPPGADWTSLMDRIETAVAGEPPPAWQPYSGAAVPWRAVRAYLALAALITLVTASVVHVTRDRAGAPLQTDRPSRAQASGGAPEAAAPISSRRAASTREDPFAAVSEQHFERSKLVILGLASRHPQTSSSADWAYERELAGTLLDDTRLYKQAAEVRGLGSLAGVMSDLELVLLQTSLSHEADGATLDRLQRLIQKRDLVSKMEMAF